MTTGDLESRTESEGQNLPDGGGGGAGAEAVELGSSAELGALVSRAVEEKRTIIRVRPSPDRRLSRWLAGAGRDRSVLIADTAGMCRVEEHVIQDQVITAETGMTIGELDNHLAQSGQWLPVSSLDRRRSIADFIDSGDGGALETFSGGPRSLVLGMRVRTGEATLVRTGGKIVKNVTGYDTSKLITGARGWLGLPESAHLRLFARPASCMALVSGWNDTAAITAEAGRLRSSGLPLSSLELADIRLFEEAAARLSAGEPDADRTGSNGQLNKLLDEIITSCGGKKLVLFATVHEHPSVAAEVEKEICQESGEVAWRNISEGAAALTADLLSDLIPLAGREAMEISLPLKAASYLLKTTMKTSDSPPWTYRPASGRFRLALSTAVGLERETGAWLERLSGFERSAGALLWQPPAVSYVLGDGTHVITRLSLSLTAPKAVQESNACEYDLLESLKSKLDPHRLFSPHIAFKPVAEVER